MGTGLLIQTRGPGSGAWAQSWWRKVRWRVVFQPFSWKGCEGGIVGTCGVATDSFRPIHALSAEARDRSMRIAARWMPHPSFAVPSKYPKINSSVLLSNIPLIGFMVTVGWRSS